MSNEGSTGPSPFSSLSTATIRDLRRDRSLAPNGSRFPELARALLPLVFGAARSLVPEDPGWCARGASAALRTLIWRWRRLPRRTVLAGYLARTVWILARRERRRRRLPELSESGGTAPALFRRLCRFRRSWMEALLLRYALQAPWPEVSKTLRFSERKTDRIAKRALRKLSKALQRSGSQLSAEAALPALWADVPPEVESEILDQVTSAATGKEKDDLVRAALRGWRWIGLKRVFYRLARAFAIVCVVAVLVALTGKWLFQNGYMIAWMVQHFNRQLVKEYPQLAVPARPWPDLAASPAVTAARAPKNSAELYSLTNVWTCALSLTAPQWARLQPAHIAPVSDMRGPDGQMVLRNPKARRSGLAGVIGLEFNWAEAALEFGGERFPKVAVRYRGNGTYVNSLYGPKQSFKIDLNKFTKGQQLAGVRTLNLVNSIPDFTYMRDAMAERLFRDLGIPAPRTGYAYVTLTAEGRFDHQPLGLFVLIENPDADFAQDRFGTRQVPIFKPVTPQLFKDLGDDWKAYQDTYDLKTKANPGQCQHLIDFAKLVTHADDAEFARRLPEFLDLDEFARFLAGHVLLSSYDGFLNNGQNYYLYLDPRSNRFGLIPWDQDHSWGEFGYVATAERRERASIWEPGTYHHRFVDRVLKVEQFRTKYRRVLEKALQELFTPERLNGQIDALAALIRPAVAAESTFRLERFDQAISTNWLVGPRDGFPEGPRAPVHQMKRFIVNRAQSVRDQLNGQSTGVILRHGR